jgi:ElaB/YqjD/DUF883 family membrane-anchored ribosome-binding protein
LVIAEDITENFDDIYSYEEMLNVATTESNNVYKKIESEVHDFLNQKKNKNLSDSNDEIEKTLQNKLSELKKDINIILDGES